MYIYIKQKRKHMAKRINISIPDEMVPDVNLIKDEIGISKFFKKCVKRFKKESENENRKMS